MLDKKLKLGTINRMDFHTKTREELIKELQELQQAHDSLKASFNRKTNEAGMLSEKVTELSWMIEHAGDAAIYRGNYQTMQYEYWSPNVEKVLGYTAQELFAMGQPGAVKLINPSDLTNLNVLISNLMAKGGGFYTIEYRFTAKDGSIKYISESGHAFVDEKNVPLYAIGSVRDITNHRKVEQALKESETLFSLFLQFSPIYVFIKEVSQTESRVITASDNFIDMIGIPSSQMKGKTMQELFPAEFASKITQDDWEVITKGNVLQLEENFNDRYFTTIKFPIVREGKTLLAGYTIDITERKRTEQMFQDIINKNPMSIQILDMDGFTIQVNSAFKKIFGAVPPPDYSFIKDPQLIQQGFTDAFEKIKKGEMVNFPNSYFNAHAVDPSFPDNPLWLKVVGFTLNVNTEESGKIVLMHENITEQTLAEEARIESENKFRTIFENSIVGKSITYLNGKLITNRAFCDIVGYSDNELSNLKWQSITHPDDIARDEAIYNSILTGEKSYNRWEKRYIKKNGDIVWVDITTTLQRDKEGNPNYFITSINDNTERKKTEQLLNISEKKYRKIFENIQDAVYQTDLNGIITDINPGIENISGYKREELIGSLVTDFYLLPEARKEMLNQMWLNGKIKDFEIKLKSKDNKISIASVSAQVVYDSEGNPTGIEGILHDITERKQAEETLRKSEELYRNLVEKLPDGVYKSTHEGKFVEVNPALVKMLGYESKEELMAIDIKSQLYFDISDRESLVLEQNNAEVGVYALKKKDGSAIWVEDNGWYNLDKNGTILFHEGIIRDITERKQAADALFKSEKASTELNTLLNSILESPHDMVVFALDANYNYTAFNKAHKRTMKQIWGVNIKVGMNMLDFILDKNDRKKAKHNFDRALKGEFFILEEEYGDAALQRVFYENRYSPIYSQQNTIIGITVFVIDITYRKQAEFELLQSKEFADANSANVTAIIEGTADNIWAFNKKYEILYINQVFQQEFFQTFGVRLEPGINLIESLPEALRPIWIPRYERVLNNEQFTIEDAIDTGSGMIYIQVTFNPIVKNGKVVGGSCFGSNITARKHAETSLIYQSQMQEILMNIASKYINIPLTKVEATIQKSLEEIGRFANVDRVYVFDYDWDNAVCNNTHEWCDAGIEPQINELQRVPLNKITWQVEPHKRGEALYIADVLAMPKGDSFRQILEAQDIKSMMTIPMMKEHVCIGFIGFDSVKNYHNYTEKEKNLFTVFAQMLVNIYNRKVLDQDLIESKDRAEESNRLKSAFLANMSHEIRTPMNGILGFAELLKRPELTGTQQQEYIRIIEKSGMRMLNIINDIIDISKIESGLMKLNIKESNINEQIEYIYTFFKPEVEGKGMNLLFKNSLPANEAIIKTDREKVYAILTNLVKNAIKYSETGTIEFGYDILEIKDSLHLQFYVKDSGIGIPKNRHEAIFERFIQADITDKMARQGAGLGLSITKAYIEMLGGKIWLESEEGIGSVFYFTLPYKAKANGNVENKNNSSTTELENQFNTKGSELKILIAEDDETSELLVSLMVKKYSKEILKVHTGLEAIEACKKNPDIDLILMDIQMPELGGYEATAQIRQFNKKVVIIAQTAYGLSGDKERAIEAGCDDYISKPISRSAIKEVIMKYFNT